MIRQKHQPILSKHDDKFFIDTTSNKKITLMQYLGIQLI